MKIGLIPMSAKPYHAGHHMLIELAAISEITDELKELELPINDKVLVFLSYSSRGTKKVKDPTDKRTLKQGARKIEIPKPGEAPVFGSDMQYIWTHLLKPNLQISDKVNFISPDEGANVIPLRNIHAVCEALKEAYDLGKETFNLPYTDSVVNTREAFINIYSDVEDIVKNYPHKKMSNLYGDLWGSQIKGIGIPRNSTVQISGTKMRQYLCDGNLEEFSSLLPPLPEDVKMEIASILSQSITCGYPLSRRKETNESVILYKVYQKLLKEIKFN